MMRGSARIILMTKAMRFMAAWLLFSIPSYSSHDVLCFLRVLHAEASGTALHHLLPAHSFYDRIHGHSG